MKFNTIKKKLEKEGLEPFSYSGRFMCGKRCVAVSVDYPGYHTLPKGYRTDSLGLGYVVYWPNVEWVDSISK